MRDTETYDDDGLTVSDALSNMELCRRQAEPVSLAAANSTVITRTDPETYDDSPGADSLGVPACALDTTVITKTDPEACDDDPGTGSLSIPLG